MKQIQLLQILQQLPQMVRNTPLLTIGYRVHSYRDVQFRIWATKVLKEYIVKGFAMNDDLLKRAGGGNYFDELLARIRQIQGTHKEQPFTCRDTFLGKL